MNIISASLVARFADVLDFGSALDNAKAKGREFSASQQRMMEDQFERLFNRFEKHEPKHYDRRELSARAYKELERRKIAAKREMERREARKRKELEAAADLSDLSKGLMIAL